MEFYLLDLHSHDCPYNITCKEEEKNKKRGRPPLPPQIKEMRKEQHKEYMREYQRQQRDIYTEEQKEEIKRKANEHYHKNKDNINTKKKEIHSLSKDATYVLRDLYLLGNIVPMTQQQKDILDKFFNLPFKNVPNAN